MVRWTRHVRFAVLSLLVGALSCTAILGIDTDYETNECIGAAPGELDPFHCGQGDCHVLVEACDGLGLPSSCPQVDLGEKTELCNDDLDNDCDGSVDENDGECDACPTAGAEKACYPGSHETRHHGVCRDGVQVCQNTVWGVCTGAVLPSKELCDDQLDNDCDDLINENCSCTDGETQFCYPGPPDTVNVGPCTQGTQTCVKGAWGNCSGVGPTYPEVCDGIDNDCNGVVDVDSPLCECEEGDELPCYDGPEGTEGIGVCSAGNYVCRNGQWGEDCEEQVQPTDEICNNLDDDCDGTQDDGVPGVGEICDSDAPGICTPGKKACSAQEMLVCVPNIQPFENDETCDGLDEDCNGVVDNGPFCCIDGEQSGDETDVDCGGSCSQKCEDGQGCLTDIHCQSNYCDGSNCVSATCGDGHLNGTESDVDCGGTCTKCIVGKNCNSGDDCLSGVCDPADHKCAKKPTGVSCLTNNECETNFCVDSFCCDDDCVGDCRACSNTEKGGGQNGICGYVLPGLDPADECAESVLVCGTTGVCDGVGECEYEQAGTPCQPSTCSLDGNTAIGAHTCDGDGSCDPGTPQGCGAYKCDPAVGACYQNCSLDAQCASTHYCDASQQCVPKGGPGAFCNTSNQCLSTFCADNRCCNNPCAGSCNTCSAVLGAIADGTCTDVANYTGNPSCNGYLCNGLYAACPASCPGGDAQCASGYFCDDTDHCVPKGVIGAPCTSAGECQSGFCADGRCCTSGCSGLCDVCSAALGAVDGYCTNVAAYAGNPSCSPYVCKASSPACPNDCTSDVHCAAGYFCAANNTCVPKQVTGQPCSAPNQCSTGYCVDGRCCDGACANACDVCSAALGASANGTCTPVVGYAGNPSCGGYVCSGGEVCPTSCPNDTWCASTHHCNGNQCTQKLATGAVCMAANQCQSGFCSDGRCCNTACGGECDVCSALLGASANGTCTPVVGYAGNPSCGGYVCSGGEACPTGCPNDTWCASTHYCNANQCAPKLPTGAVCSAANACQSGFCANNRCCDQACTGACDVCAAALGAPADGNCEPVSGYAGSPSCAPYLCSGGQATCPTDCAGGCVSTHYCSGSNQCVPKLPLGSSCGASIECQSAFCVDGRCCDGACNGACNVCAASLGASANGTCTNVVGYAGNPSCGAYVCSGADTCPTSCTTDAQCVAGRYCDAGECVPKLSNGAVCTAGNQCQDGFCADGRCCNTVCNGACNACELSLGATADGTCTLVAGYGGNPSCGGYVCTGASATCPTSCPNDTWCASTHYCSGNLCVSKLPLGASCTAANQCQSGSCSDGRCCDGACGGACDVCAASLGATADGACTNVAGYPGNPSCNGYACSAASPACPTDCTSNAQCLGTHYCSGSNQCVPKLGPGSICSAANACQSGFCADSRCCDQACGGHCDVCAASLGASANGTCTNAVGYAGSPSCGDYVCSGGADCPTVCTSHAQCASTHYCNGNQCVPKGDIGDLCGAAAACASGSCADGRCCDAACSGPCNVCAASLGATADGVCTNVAGYAGNPSCNGYACTAASPACPTACTSDAQCLGSHHCNGSNQCVPKLALGAACSTASACQSGICVDGVCCNALCDQLCMACNAAGLCDFVPSGGPDAACPDEGESSCGFNGRCNGAGSCQLYPNGTPCSQGACIDGTTMENPADTCDGLGACQVTAEVECLPYACNAVVGECSSACLDESDCAPSYYCDALGACVALKIEGELCADAGECGSGFCVDGVCCNAACSGACDACTESLKGGGLDGECGLASAGTVCQDPQCQSSATLTEAYTCDATGACDANGTQSCSPYTCISSVGADACATSCTSDAECESGWYCGGASACLRHVVLALGGGTTMVGGTFVPGSGWTETSISGGGTTDGVALAIDTAGRGVGLMRDTSVTAPHPLRYVTWDPTPSTWTTFQTIGSPAVTTGAPPAISAGSTKSEAVYQQASGTSYLYAALSAAWSPTAQNTSASGTAARAASIAVLPSGNAGMAYVSGNSVLFVERSAATGTWGPAMPTNLFTGTAAPNTAPALVAMTGGTTVYMVVYTTSGGQMRSRTRDGTTWTTALSIGDNTHTTASQVALAALPGSKAVLAYRSSASPAGRLYTSFYNGTAWSTPAEFSNGFTIAGSPAIALGVGVGTNAASVELAWVQAGTIRHTRCTLMLLGVCNTWTTPVQVSATTVSTVAIASAR